MAEFTPTQGRYLSFIQAYINGHGFPPAESEIAAAMCVSPPSVNQMVRNLEKKGLILRQPGVARSLQILISEDEIPDWKTGATGPRRGRRKTNRRAVPLQPVTQPAAPAKLYVLTVFLAGGPISKKFANKVASRTIEIRGDQTLEDLHNVLFQAYDREEQHLYEFQLGKRPFDPKGPDYGLSDLSNSEEYAGDLRQTTIDDLGLTDERVFGYRFDFGDEWYHQIQVDRVEDAIPTVPYPRVTKRVGKSPPQYS